MLTYWIKCILLCITNTSLLGCKASFLTKYISFMNSLNWAVFAKLEFMQGKFSFNQFFSEKLKEKLENAGIGRSLAQSFPQNLSCFGFLLILKISISKNYQNFNKLNAQILNPSEFFFSPATVSKERRWQDQKFTITLGFRVCFFPYMLFVHVCLFYICWHFLLKNLINLATLSFIPSPPLTFQVYFYKRMKFENEG